MVCVRQVQVRCPYCGHEERHAVEEVEQEPSTFVVTCPPERGGCATVFGVEVRAGERVDVATCLLPVPSLRSWAHVRAQKEVARGREV